MGACAEASRQKVLEKWIMPEASHLRPKCARRVQTGLLRYFLDDSSCNQPWRVLEGL
ncbi:hypothetical protein COLO4_15003 [Corchorus olitorius]|uniref:Uncharacterized protein n=1 Tax=Corchorus olitorius TaxID=93759 RepID=A0A1R3JPZ0_9ROSI|nr:hypothetical protein COLO4_15003 [Corchorus olitorius]